MDIVVVGRNGANGAEGTASHPNGHAGGAGSQANIIELQSPAEQAVISVEAIGGSGGNGGNGVPLLVASGAIDLLGSGGAGGAGGNATASVSTTGHFSVATKDSATAVGGAGGIGGEPSGLISPATGGNGGAANATASDTAWSQAGSKAMASATGGNGGMALGQGGNALATANDQDLGGNSTAKATATAGLSSFAVPLTGTAGITPIFLGATTASADASASAGYGDLARAIAAATGGTAAVNAVATSHASPTTTLVAGSFVTSIVADAAMTGRDGLVNSEALANYEGGLVGMTSLTGGLADGEAVPGIVVVDPPGSPSIPVGLFAQFSTGELGGVFTGTDSGAETSTSSITTDISLSKLGHGGYFILSLFGGQVFGNASDISQISLNVERDGQSLFVANYATAADALAAFSGTTPMLVASPDDFTASGSTGIQVMLTVTTDAPGAGFVGDFSLGAHLT